MLIKVCFTFILRLGILNLLPTCVLYECSSTSLRTVSDLLTLVHSAWGVRLFFMYLFFAVLLCYLFYRLPAEFFLNVTLPMFSVHRVCVSGKEHGHHDV